MVVDTVAVLRRATDAAWGWITEHMELRGSGLARLLSHDQLLGTYDPANPKTLLLWIRRRRRLYDLPLGRGTGGAAYGGFWHGSLWWYCTGTWNGYEQQGWRARWYARCWKIRVRRREPTVPRGDSSIASPALAAATGWLEVVQVGRPGVTVRLWGTSWALMSSLGCSPRSVLVGV